MDCLPAEHLPHFGQVVETERIARLRIANCVKRNPALASQAAHDAFVDAELGTKGLGVEQGAGGRVGTGNIPT
jgi:hypothetical protein